MSIITTCQRCGFQQDGPFLLDIKLLEGSETNPVITITCPSCKDRIMLIQEKEFVVTFLQESKVKDVIPVKNFNNFLEGALK